MATESIAAPEHADVVHSSMQLPECGNNGLVSAPPMPPAANPAMVVPGAYSAGGYSWPGAAAHATMPSEVSSADQMPGAGVQMDAANHWHAVHAAWYASQAHTALHPAGHAEQAAAAQAVQGADPTAHWHAVHAAWQGYAAQTGPSIARHPDPAFPAQASPGSYEAAPHGAQEVPAMAGTETAAQMFSDHSVPGLSTADQQSAVAQPSTNSAAHELLHSAAAPTAASPDQAAIASSAQPVALDASGATPQSVENAVVEEAGPGPAEPLLRIGADGHLESGLDVVERVFLGSDNHADDDPVNLVTVFGPSRQGKSSLLNLLSGSSSFGVGNEMDPMTKGVDISPVLIPLDRFSKTAAAAGAGDCNEDHQDDSPVSKATQQRGWFSFGRSAPVDEKVVIGFADVEGQGDRDDRYDMKIFCPMMLFSKVIILNWKGAIEKNRLLELLRRTVRLAAECVEEDASKMEQRGHLHVVFRDWIFKDEVAQVRSILFDDEPPAAGDDVTRRNETRAAIRRSFASLHVWLLPTPVLRVENPEDLHNIHTKTNSFSPMFTVKLDALRRTLAAQLCCSAVFSGKRLTGRSISRLLPHIVHRLNADGVLRLHSLHRTMVDDEIWQIVRKSARQLQKEMVPYIEDEQQMLSKAAFNQEWRRIAEEYWPKLVERIDDMQAEEESQTKGKRTWDDVWEGWAASRSPDLGRRLAARAKAAQEAAQKHYDEQFASSVSGCLPLGAQRLEAALRQTSSVAVEEFRRRCVYDSPSELAAEEKTLQSHIDACTAEARTANAKAIKERASELQSTTRETMRDTVAAAVAEWRRYPPPGEHEADFDAWWTDLWRRLIAAPRAELAELGQDEPSWFTTDFDATWAGFPASRAGIRAEVGGLRRAHVYLASCALSGDPQHLTASVRLADEAQLASEVVAPVRERLAELMRIQSSLALAEGVEALASTLREAASVGLQGHSITNAQVRLRNALAEVVAQKASDAQAELVSLAVDGDALVAKSVLLERQRTARDGVVACIAARAEGALEQTDIDALRESTCQHWEVWFVALQQQHHAALRAHAAGVRQRVSKRIQTETLEHASDASLPPPQELERAWEARRLSALEQFHKECIHDHVGELEEDVGLLNEHLQEHLRDGHAKAKVLRCEAALADAVKEEDEDSLRYAIFAARQAGAEAGTVERGEAALRRIIAEKELANATDGKDPDAVLAAIASALEAGVHAQKVGVAETRHKVIVASEALSQATARGDETALQHALAVARQVGVDAEEVAVAKATLRNLVATRELRAAMRADDIGSLMSALSAARAANCDSDEVQTADRQLQTLLAAKCLDEAVQSNDETALQHALQAAEEAGVAHSAVEEGAKKLAFLKARRELAEACNLEDEHTLRDALSAARAAGVEEAEIASAESVLKRAIASNDLSKAHDSGHHENLQAAIHAAKEAGVASHKVGAAEARHRVLVASALLSLARSSPDEDAVRRALATAREVGVDDAETLEAVTAHLRRLVAARELTAAMQGQDIGTLRRWLDEAAEAGVDSELVKAASARHRLLAVQQELADAEASRSVDRLQHAIAEAKEIGADQAQIDSAEALGMQLIAEKSVSDAAQLQDENALGQALALAKEVGVNQDFLASGQRKLQALQVARRLGNASKAGDEIVLLKAIETAKSTEVRPDVLAASEAAYRKLVATRVLTDAMRAENEEQLRAALDGAEEAGVDDEKVEQGQQLLQKLAATAYLSEATRGEDGPALIHAIENARAAGVASDVLAVSERKLQELTASRRLAESLEGHHEEYTAAMAHAREIGLDTHSIATAEARRQKHVVTTAVVDAMGAHCETTLTKALASARQSGVDADVIASGESKLNNLAVARKLAAAAADGDENTLTQAIEAAKEAGIDAEKVQVAELTLRRNIAARELTAAVNAQKEPELRVAVEEAREAGVDPDACASAEASLRKLAATNGLADAMGGSDESVLQHAIEEAQLASVRKGLILKAQSRLRAVVAERELMDAADQGDEQKFKAAWINAREAGLDASTCSKADARRKMHLMASNLTDAIRSKDVSMLQEAIAAGQDAGVDAASIKVAEEELAKLTSMQCLHEAHEASDEHAIRKALDVAKQSGVESSKLQHTEKRLRVFDASRKLSQAAGGEDEAALDSAIREAHEAGVGIDQLQNAAHARRRLAIARELTSACDTGDRDQLRRLLAEAHEVQLSNRGVAVADLRLRTLDAKARLSAALQSRNEDALREAVAAAQAVNMKGEELFTAAKEQLRQIPYEKAISKAIQQQDEIGLESVITAAVAASLPADKISEARKNLQQLKAMYDLEEACNGDDEAVLATAIDTATAAGVASALIEGAKLRCKELTTTHKLIETMATEDPSKCGALRRAVADAETAGVGEALLAAARARLDELAARQAVTHATRANLAIPKGQLCAHELAWTGKAEDGRQNVAPNRVQWTIRVLGGMTVNLEVFVRLKSSPSRPGDDASRTLQLEKEAHGEHFTGSLAPHQNKKFVTFAGGPADPAVLCSQIDVVVFKFSNAFSWFNAKELEVITVLEYPQRPLPPLPAIPSLLISPHKALAVSRRGSFSDSSCQTSGVSAPKHIEANLNEIGKRRESPNGVKGERDTHWSRDLRNDDGQAEHLESIGKDVNDVHEDSARAVSVVYNHRNGTLVSRQVGAHGPTDADNLKYQNDGVAQGPSIVDISLGDDDSDDDGPEMYTLSPQAQGKHRHENGRASHGGATIKEEHRISQGPEVYDMGGQDTDTEDMSTRDEEDDEARFFGGIPIQELHNANAQLAEAKPADARPAQARPVETARPLARQQQRQARHSAYRGLIAGVLGCICGDEPTRPPASGAVRNRSQARAAPALTDAPA